MTANRARRLVFLLVLICVGAGGGCRAVRQIEWAVGEQEDPRDRWREYRSPGYGERAQDIGEVRQQRAQNEADYLARNPGTRR